MSIFHTDMTSIGLNTEERAVFTQLKPVRMCGADGPEDSVFEDVKPAVRLEIMPSLGLLPSFSTDQKQPVF